MKGNCHSEQSEELPTTIHTAIPNEKEPSGGIWRTFFRYAGRTLQARGKNTIGMWEEHYKREKEHTLSNTNIF